VSSSNPKKVTSTPKLPTAPPSPQEAERVEIANARVKARRKAVRIDYQDDPERTVAIGPGHTDMPGFMNRVMDAFGTASESFALSQLNRLLNAAKPNREGKTDEVTANALIAAVEGIRPENELEGMLAVEMAVTHHLGIEALHRLRGAQTLPEYQVYGNVASKLLRTYTAQVEALARLRRKGEQKVRVEHVHVHPGGQAIVGAVETSAGIQGPADAKAITHAPVGPLWGEHEKGQSVPLASDAERPVPHARGRLSGSSKR